MILVSWDPKVNQYAAFGWTQPPVARLTSGVACRAIPLVIHPLCIYDFHRPNPFVLHSATMNRLIRGSGSIDNVSSGKPERFANVELSRLK